MTAPDLRDGRALVLTAGPFVLMAYFGVGWIQLLTMSMFFILIGHATRRPVLAAAGYLPALTIMSCVYANPMKYLSPMNPEIVGVCLLFGMLGVYIADAARKKSLWTKLAAVLVASVGIGLFLAPHT